ncbi:hypothetical protein [Chryseobacterium sp. 2R14A]|uniref:hypothetical protein n=1 Tax=Chryseobacterium sp. 2R14A TaxID=3380353 RepID=UPI003CF5FFD7
MADCFDDINLENVNHCPNDETVAGLSTTLYYIPAPHITTFTKPAKTAKYDVAATILSTGLVADTGKGWKKIDVQVDKNQLTNLQIGSKGNLKLRGQLDVFIPGFKKALVGFQRAHLNTPMIFGIPDSEGQMWIIGTPDSPAYFASMSLASGTNSEEDSGITAQIIANSTVFAYDGDLTVLPDTP